MLYRFSYRWLKWSDVGCWRWGKVQTHAENGEDVCEISARSWRQRGNMCLFVSAVLLEACEDVFKEEEEKKERNTVPFPCPPVLFLCTVAWWVSATPLQLHPTPSPPRPIHPALQPTQPTRSDVNFSCKGGGALPPTEDFLPPHPLVSWLACFSSPHLCPDHCFSRLRLCEEAVMRHKNPTLTGY